MPQFDVLCVGSAKIDIFLSIPKDSPYVHLDSKTNSLSVAYGQKIPAEQSSIMLGGNACNVSVGLAKLQIKTTVMAEIGTDEFSQKIINGLKTENVDTSFLIQNPYGPSSFSVILSFNNERTIFGQHSKREHNFSFEGVSAKLAYLTSLGFEWQNAYKKTLEFAKKTATPLAFNPGTPQLSMGVDSFKDILAISDILFINKEEGELLASTNEKNIKDLLSKVKQLGPKIVVITDGENGSCAMDEKNDFFSEPIVPTTIVEKTGAGDAYASGFLAATLFKYPLQTAMKWGTLNASGTMSAIGAQNGLLSKKEMEERING